MNFKMTEIVDSPDPELVLRVLETCLLAQWTDVTREGGTIVLRGLGASHRAVNRNDRTVFMAIGADEGKTAVVADVTYQASALVGTAAPQNEMVQRKLASVLEMVRMDLDLAQRRRAQTAERAAGPVPVDQTVAGPEVGETLRVEEAVPVEVVPVEAVPAVAEAAVAEAAVEDPEVVDPEVAEAAPAEVAPVETAPEPGASSVERMERVVEAPAPEPADVIGNPAQPPVTYPDLPVAHRDLPVAHRDLPVAYPDRAVLISEPPTAAEEVRLVHREEIEETEDEASSSGARTIFVTLVMIAVVAGLAWGGWHYRAQLGPYRAELAPYRARVNHYRVELSQWVASFSAVPAKAPQPAPESDASAAGAGSEGGSSSGTSPSSTTSPASATNSAAATGAATAVGPGAGTATTAAHEQNAAAGNNNAVTTTPAAPDPRVWLQSWAEALSGRDAALQASYYADPVDKYFLKRNVSRAAVMADKQAIIAERTGSWTLQLEDVQVIEKTATTARILLVKHFLIIEAGTPEFSQRLPTQLKLRLIDGQWKITSEQTLG